MEEGRGHGEVFEVVGGGEAGERVGVLVDIRAQEVTLRIAQLTAQESTEPILGDGRERGAEAAGVVVLLPQRGEQSRARDGLGGLGEERARVREGEEEPPVRVRGDLDRASARADGLLADEPARAPREVVMRAEGEDP